MTTEEICQKRSKSSSIFSVNFVKLLKTLFKSKINKIQVSKFLKSFFDLQQHQAFKKRQFSLQPYSRLHPTKKVKRSRQPGITSVTKKIKQFNIFLSFHFYSFPSHPCPHHQRSEVIFPYILLFFYIHWLHIFCTI